MLLKNEYFIIVNLIQENLRLTIKHVAKKFAFNYFDIINKLKKIFMKLF